MWIKNHGGGSSNDNDNDNGVHQHFSVAIIGGCCVQDCTYVIYLLAE